MDGSSEFDEHHSVGLLERIAEHELAPIATIPVEEVKLHAVEGDCWSILYGTVYDLTQLVATHSGPTGPVLEGKYSLFFRVPSFVENTSPRMLVSLSTIQFAARMAPTSLMANTEATSPRETCY